MTRAYYIPLFLLQHFLNLDVFHQNEIHIYFQLTAIKDSLKLLEPGHFLALHGMPVAGKSVLAAEAVRDADITLQV